MRCSTPGCQSAAICYYLAQIFPNDHGIEERRVEVALCVECAEAMGRTPGVTPEGLANIGDQLYLTSQLSGPPE